MGKNRRLFTARNLRTIRKSEVFGRGKPVTETRDLLTLITAGLAPSKTNCYLEREGEVWRGGGAQPS